MSDRDSFPGGQKHSARTCGRSHGTSHIMASNNMLHTGTAPSLPVRKASIVVSRSFSSIFHHCSKPTVSTLSIGMPQLRQSHSSLLEVSTLYLHLGHTCSFIIINTLLFPIFFLYFHCKLSNIFCKRNSFDTPRQRLHFCRI